MKKYIFSRLLRSLVSLFAITTLTYVLIFTMVPRTKIFNNDPNYTKMAAQPDKKVNYENGVYERMGYINYWTSKELLDKANDFDPSVTGEVNDTNKKIYEDYIASLGNGWTLHQFPESGAFYATREISMFSRVLNFFTNLIEIDHPWRIKDAKNPDLERYLRFENDPSAGFALVGSGTKHKYLLYFNGQFPFIHQNFVNLNLGVSYPTFSKVPVLQIITQTQGKKLLKEVTFPNGTKRSSSIDIYSRTYQTPSSVDKKTAALFGEGDAYTKTQNLQTDPSMIANSALIGIFGVMISYLIALPLGYFMAQHSGKLFDSISSGTLTFLIAIPSIAFIYVFRFLGSLTGLPDLFPTYGAQDIRSYILPALVLGFLGSLSLGLWTRRYLVDQKLSDYVRFARAKGLNEKEIMTRHIFKNAMVPIVAGIPGAILGVIVGATFTETVFAFPGMGKMLIDAIKANNINMVVGLNFIFSALSILAVFLGDLFMTVLDPRIKLSTKGGGK
ncbi:ABC transporter permease [Streptococcus sp. E17BB]|uniref:ABC transporter permease n=1 Tax=Streptococcus sp. E17BB TaxID=3278714 RepID=UPI00359EDFB0